VLLACGAAACIHPDGPGALGRAIEGVLGGSSEVLRKHYFEFMPTFSERYADSVQTWMLVVLIGLVVGIWLVAWRRRGRPWFELLCLAALGYLGFSSFRFVTTAAFALPVLVVVLESKAVRPSRKEPTLWPSVATVGAAIMALALSFKVAAWGYTTPSGGPRHLGVGLDPNVATLRNAADFVARLPIRGGIFNEHVLGAFLAWQWDGKPKVFFHGYVPDASFYERDYLGISRSPEEFDRIVRTYDLSVFFLEMRPITPESPLLYHLLLGRPEWRLVFWDKHLMVFLRDRPEHRAIIEQYEFRYFDPFRTQKIDLGMRENPERLREEALRVLRSTPMHESARRFLRDWLRVEPEELVSGPGRNG
jgi:hypothetical protein